jgi:hypothetical protein
MSIRTFEVAAATAVAGYNLMVGSPYAVSDRPRVIRRVAFTGSAVVEDCSVTVNVGGSVEANMWNNTLGSPNADTDMFVANISVPAGATLTAPMLEGATTSSVYLRLEIDG